MQMQQLNLGVQILEESSVFTEGLKAWYQRPQNQHTWESFKTHAAKPMFGAGSASAN